MGLHGAYVGCMWQRFFFWRRTEGSLLLLVVKAPPSPVPAFSCPEDRLPSVPRYSPSPVPPALHPLQLPSPS